MLRRPQPVSATAGILTTPPERGAWIRCPAQQTVFAQGDPSDAVYYLHRGKVKISAVSEHGRAAVIAILSEGDFFGDCCLAGRDRRTVSAAALTDCELVRSEREAFLAALKQQAGLLETFTAGLLSRNLRLEENLANRNLYSSEKRLVRILLALSEDDCQDGQSVALPRVSQEALAEMVGTTRARINYFMNKFRKLGLVEYKDRLAVDRSGLADLLGR